MALAVAAALTVLAAAGPASGKAPLGPRVQNYKVTQGEGSVKVTFRGDEATGCRARGTCSISGTTTFAFGGEPEYGQVYWLRVRKRTRVFSGFFETHGETVSDVVTAGGDEHCVDRVSGERIESMDFEPRSKRVRFTWRKFFEEDDEGPTLGYGPGDEPFDTRCAGPAQEDMKGALPFADVPYRVFRSPRSSFRTTGTRPFAGGGFAGTVEWDLTYGFQFRARRAR